MNTCKTCQHWMLASEDHDGSYEVQMTAPIDPDTYEPMVMEFEVRICEHPAKTLFERPVERNGFGLSDGSQYWVMLATAEDFGCVRHEPSAPAVPQDG